jgi:hypothetical protein
MERMKVYVAGQLNDLENVRLVQAKLVESGHTLTHDWTEKETGNQFLSSPEAKLKNLSETKRRAHVDVQAIIDSDAVVLCTNNTEQGKGMYVELGAALALNVATGKPRVYILGQLNHMSIFYFHQAAKRVQDIPELIDQMGEH